MTAGSRPPSEPAAAVDVLARPDPVRAVLDAHAEGRRIALRTSGTTGTPRCVLRTPASWVDSFGTVAALTGLTEGSRMWLPGPMSSTMSLFAAVLARHVGAVVVDGPARATHAHLTPLLLRRVLAELPQGLRLTVAGERLTRSLHERTVAAGAVVSHYHGSAEQSFVAWGSHAEDLRPFPGVEVRVVDGEIWSRSAFLCDGYAGPPGPLRTDADGWATVGDRGRFEDGVLTVLGRGGEAVTTGAATVLVSDVEAALRTVAAGEVVVVGLPHPLLGQVVAGVLTDRDDLTRVRRTARRLTTAQRPRRWFHVPRPPLTEAGKVDRPALAAMLGTAGAVALPER